jgi:hypothetical protein
MWFQLGKPHSTLAAFTTILVVVRLLLRQAPNHPCGESSKVCASAAVCYEICYEIRTLGPMLTAVTEHSV